MTSLFAIPDYNSTPVKGSDTRLSAGADNLNAGRISLNDSIGAAVPALPVKAFLDRVLPPLHPDLKKSFKKIMDYLKDPEANIYDSYKPGWIAFVNQRPNANEETRFKALVKIAVHIEAAVVSVLSNSRPRQFMKFDNAPNSAPKSDWRVGRQRPDAYFHLRAASGPKDPRYHWMDIGPTGEYKRSATDAATQDNTSKVLWNMYHSLRDDPQRRFAFAFSIENEKMRLWFTNRAAVLISEVFNIMARPDYLVHFFLAFLYGTRASCGWDPSMEYIKGTTNPLQYYITVNDSLGNKHVYKTVDIESSIGAEALRGRGTRVWRAVPWDRANSAEIGDPVALKDCWVDQTRELEGDVIQQLDTLAGTRIKILDQKLRDLTSQRCAELTNDVLETEITRVERSLNAAKALKASLLIPLVHGVVAFPTPDVKDSTFDHNASLPGVAHWEYIFQQMKDGPEGDKQREDLQKQLLGEHRAVHDYANIRRELIWYDSKYHYRIVYGEVCKPLYKIPRLDRIFDYLCFVLLALEGLHEAGWVHRDISPGNILITAKEFAKLTDWEYAKEFGPNPTKVHDIRTGTVDFMAVEVDKGAYLFLPTALQQDPGDEKSAIRLLHKRKDAPAPSKVPPWRYNPLHDVESVLWLTKFFSENKDISFFSKVNGSKLDDGALAALGIEQDESEALRSARLTKQHNHAMKLFHRSDGRMMDLQTPRETLDKWYLHPELAARDFHLEFEKMRAALYSEYVNLERGFVTDPSMPFPFDSKVYRSLRIPLASMSVSMGLIDAYVHVEDLSPVAIRSQDAHKPIQIAKPNYRRKTVPTGTRGPSIHVVLSDDPQVEPLPAAEVEAQQPGALSPLATEPSRSQSRTGSRAGSRLGSRPGSRTGLRSASRAQDRPQDTGAQAAGASGSASKTQRRATVTQARPSGGLATAGRPKSRATTPIPTPAPAPTTTPRTQPPSATQDKNGPKGHWRY